MRDILLNPIIVEGILIFTVVVYRQILEIFYGIPLVIIYCMPPINPLLPFNLGAHLEMVHSVILWTVTIKGLKRVINVVSSVISDDLQQ